MSGHLMRHLSPAIFLAVTLAAPASAAGQLKEESKGDGPTARKQPTVTKQKKQNAELERKIAELRAKRAKGEKVPSVVTLLEAAYYGPRYYSSSGPRFFVAKLTVANLSGKPLAIKQGDITLQADGKTFRIPPAVSNQFSDFYVGTKRYTLGNLKMAKALSIKPGGTASTWILFDNISSSKTIPRMTLRFNVNRQQTSIDVNRHESERLKLTVERIGPRKGLGLMTIAGQLTTISIGSVIAEIDKLTKNKDRIQRFVIRWTAKAPALNTRLLSWLRERAMYAGQSRRRYYSSYPFPDFPGSIRELHLAQYPGAGSNMSSYRSPGSVPNRIHKTDVDAVSAALKSAYEALPRKEILDEIESGHPLTRAAALASGGGRLGAEQLPMILKFANGKDEKLARAALQALRDFGERPAIETLTKFAKAKSSPLNQAAIVSLSASRFPVAHRALLAILKSAPRNSKKNIVKVLAAHPRPIWSDPIYEFAKDPETGIGVEALKALGVIGHPKLQSVLAAALKSKNASVRSEAMRQLIARADAESDALALDYTLQQLKTSPPDSYMRQVLMRTKDRRAIPLLLAQLDNKGGSKSTLIDTLARLGDQSVGRKLLKRYTTIKSSYDKSRIMQAMVKLKTPGIRKLAGEALMTKDSSLVSAACDALRRDASPEAVQMLIDALDKSTYSSAWSYTSSSLAQIGTKKARVALVRIRDGLENKTSNNDKQKLRYIVNAIRSLMQRSPAYQYVYQAWQLTRMKKYKDAIAQCNVAARLDPEHPWPISARGHIHLLQKKIAEARKDFNAAYKIDPHDPHAITGIALLKSRDGKTEDAVKLVARHSSEFSSDRFYPYHAARVYARGIVALKKAKPSKERTKKIAAYGKEAMKLLKTAMTRGRHYSDGYKAAHVRAEADFAPLRNLKEYKTLIGGDSKKKGKQAGVAKKLDVQVDP